MFTSGPQNRRMDHSRLPNLDIVDLFSENTPANPLLIHRCLVVSGAHKFLIYGYVREGAHVNEALKAIRPSVSWKGEIVAFKVGQEVPVLSRSRVRREIFNQAVSRQVIALHSYVFPSDKSPI